MNIGRLSDYINIKRKVETDDGMGGSTIELTNILTCWAQVAAPSNKSRIIGGTNLDVSTHVVTLRTPTMRIKQDDLVEWETPYGQVTLTVKAVRPNFQKGYIQLDCVEYG